MEELPQFCHMQRGFSPFNLPVLLWQMKSDAPDILSR